MRIIAGEFRGRKLLPPATDATRPVTDRVKQSLFDILTPCLPDAHVFDCFAGTGSMGLESLSRGAASAVFFESDRSAYDRLIANIRTLGVADRALALNRDLFKWFRQPTFPDKFNRPSNLIFLDPPYAFLKTRIADLRGLAKQLSACLAAGGTVVFRHDARDSLDLPSLRRTDFREYGGMAVELLEALSSPLPSADDIAAE